MSVVDIRSASSRSGGASPSLCELGTGLSLILTVNFMNFMGLFPIPCSEATGSEMQW